MYMENQKEDLSYQAIENENKPGPFEGIIQRLRPFGICNWDRSTVKISLSLALMLLCAGPMIDCSRAFIAQHQLARATDIAALELSAFVGQSPERLERMAQRYFQANHPDNKMGQGAKFSLSVVNGKLTIRATSTVPTLVMGFLGIPAMHVGINTEIAGSDRKKDVAKVLDIPDFTRLGDLASLNLPEQ